MGKEGNKDGSPGKKNKKKHLPRGVLGGRYGNVDRRVVADFNITTKRCSNCHESIGCPYWKVDGGC